MTLDLNKANNILSDITGRYICLWSFVSNFRFVSNACYDLKEAHLCLQKSFETGFGQFISDPEVKKTLSKYIEDDNSWHGIINEAVSTAIQNSRMSIDAACIVFMHSILDACVIDLLDLTTKLDRDSWMTYIMERKVTMAELKKNTIPELENIYITKCFNEFRMKSIVTKCNQIYNICKCSYSSKASEKYVYNENELKIIDTLRHDIVHGLRVNIPIDDCEHKLDYLKRTGVHFILLISGKYRLDLLHEYVAKSILKWGADSALYNLLKN